MLCCLPCAQFIPEAVFLSKPWALGTLGAHLLCLLVFLNSACKAEGGFLGFVRQVLCSSTWSPAAPSARYITTVLFVANFIGVMFARSLHYQFYSWYYFSLPFLLWQTELPALVRYHFYFSCSSLPSSLVFLNFVSSCLAASRFALIATIELSWNVYPATWWSSLLLFASHALLLVALLRLTVEPLDAPAPKDVKQQ